MQISKLELSGFPASVFFSSNMTSDVSDDHPGLFGELQTFGIAISTPIGPNFQILLATYRNFKFDSKFEFSANFQELNSNLYLEANFQNWHFYLYFIQKDRSRNSDTSRDDDWYSESYSRSTSKKRVEKSGRRNDRKSPQSTGPTNPTKLETPKNISSPRRLTALERLGVNSKGKSYTIKLTNRGQSELRRYFLRY